MKGGRGKYSAVFMSGRSAFSSRSLGMLLDKGFAARLGTPDPSFLQSNGVRFPAKRLIYRLYGS